MLLQEKKFRVDGECEAVRTEIKEVRHSKKFGLVLLRGCAPQGTLSLSFFLSLSLSLSVCLSSFSFCFLANLSLPFTPLLLQVNRSFRILQSDVVRLNTLITQNKGLQQQLLQDTSVMEADFLRSLKDDELKSIQMQER